MISQESVVAKGFDNLQRAVDHAGSLGDENSYRIANPVGLAGGSVVGRGIPAGELDRYLSKRMTKKIDVNWGDMSRYVCTQFSLSQFSLLRLFCSVESCMEQRKIHTYMGVFVALYEVVHVHG